MAQLNLICHGMMLFIEGKTTFDILVPDIKEHDFRIGSPGGMECGPFPADLPSGHYDLTGIANTSGQGLASLAPDQHLLLHRDKFTIVRRERIAISVPKPSRVRLFRTVRPDNGQRTADVIFGNVPRDTALGEPTVLHDVIALIYDGLAEGTTVRFNDVLTHVLDGAAPTNVNVYAQAGPGAIPHNRETSPHHETGLNDLLQLVGGKHPDFMLSKVGKAAAETGSQVDGIGPCDMASLSELSDSLTSGTGCSSAFVLMR
jgi:hypothetical protein